MVTVEISVFHHEDGVPQSLRNLGKPDDRALLTLGGGDLPDALGLEREREDLL